MAFNSEWRINAPLKKFMGRINAINNAWNNWGHSYSLALTYGNSVYSRQISGNYPYYECKIRGGFKTGFYQTTIAGFEHTNTVEHATLTEYLDGQSWRDVRAGMVALFSVKKLSEVANYSYANRLYTGAELGFVSYDPEVSALSRTSAGGTFLATHFDTGTGQYRLQDVEEFTKYKDWYVITGVSYYGGDTLPRVKLTNTSPTIIVGAAQTMIVNDGRELTILDMSKAGLVFTLGTVFQPWTTNYSAFSSTTAPFNILGNNLWSTFGDVFLSSHLQKNYNYPYIASYAQPQTVLESAYGSRLVLCHNNANDTPTGSDVATNIVGFVDGEKMFLPIAADNSITSRVKMIFPDIQSIIDMFADFGIPATTEQSVAENFPTNIFPNVDISAGYDTNPTPTIDSYPDNSTSDFEIKRPLLPFNPAVDTTVFNAGNVDSLMRWLTTSTFYDNISRLFNEPLSAIIALRYYPFDIVQHDSAHTTLNDTVSIVNVTAEGITGYSVGDDYNAVISGGSMEYTAYYGNFADWTNCRYQIYIPYVGIVDVPPSHVINRRLDLSYIVDFLTGKTTAILKSYDKDTNIGNVVLMRECSLSVDVPITYSNFNQQQLTRAMSVLSGVQSTVSGAANGASGGVAGAVAGALTGAVGGAMNAAQTYITTPLEMGAVGTVGSSGGYNLPQTAYLIINKRPLAVPSNGFESVSGRASSAYQPIGDVSGLVKCENARLDINCTQAEKDEISSLLSGGVYV